MKLKDGEAARIADFLTRVVPRSAAEQAELVSHVKRLQGGRS